MPESDILMERLEDKRVVLITLNRPSKLNAFTEDMLIVLERWLTDIEDDDSVNAVVVTGAGEKAFSAGLDLDVLSSARDDEQFFARLVQRERPFMKWATFKKPLIAGLNGLSYGAGAILAVAADIRVGGEASQFRFTGILGDYVDNTWHLPKVVGVAKATDWILTGRQIEPDEATQAGLFTYRVEAKQVVTKAIEMAALIAENPTRGVQGAKRLIRENVTRGFADGFNAQNQYNSMFLRVGLGNHHLDWWRTRRSA